jgi:hypothetical protein
MVDLFEFETLQMYEIIFSTKVGMVYACIQAVDSIGRQAPLLPFQSPNVVGVICGTFLGWGGAGLIAV